MSKSVYTEMTAEAARAALKSSLEVVAALEGLDPSTLELGLRVDGETSTGRRFGLSGRAADDEERVMLWDFLLSMNERAAEQCRARLDELGEAES